MLKTIAPAISWGVFFLKLALATQGLGAAVPNVNVADMLPEFGDDYVNLIAQTVATNLQSQVGDSLNSSVDELAAKMDIIADDDTVLPDALDAVSRLVFAAEMGSGATWTPEWRPAMTGLKLVPHSDGVSGSVRMRRPPILTGKQAMLMDIVISVTQTAAPSSPSRHLPSCEVSTMSKPGRSFRTQAGRCLLVSCKACS
jgi:hypothetical protein